MASAADLSGRVIKFACGASPTTFEIISGSVEDSADVSGYLPTGTGTIKRHVGHGRTVTYSFTGVLITTNFPWAIMVPGAAVTNVEVELDQTAGTPDEHTSTDAVVESMRHEFSTDTHQVWSAVLKADGNYTLPS
jgi:hypothetical protein